MSRSQRRYGALTTAERVRLLLVFLVVQIPVWVFFSSLGVRACLAILTAAVLAIVAVTRPPTRRSSPR